MTGNALSPEIPVHVRRRSADVGGLYRATANQGGHGWVGYEKPELEEGPPQFVSFFIMGTTNLNHAYLEPVSLNY